MFRKRKVTGRIIVSIFSAVLLLETGIRIIAPDSVIYRLRDKSLHTIDKDGITIRLRPEQDLSLPFRGDSTYSIRTNRRGERVVVSPHTDIAGSKRSPTRKTTDREIWVIGDSVAMGYGLTDEQSFPSRIASLTSISVRNLAVDGIGARGILKILKENLSETRASNRSGSRSFRQIDVIWIFHPSDFIDDARDTILQKDFIRRWAFQIHFLLGRYSAVYNTILVLRQNLNSADFSPVRNHYTVIPPPDSSSKTFFYTDQIINLTRENGLPLTVVFYPDKNEDNLLPSEPVEAALRMMDHMKKKNISIIDATPLFKKNGKAGLYIPGDGHPSHIAAELFARIVNETTIPNH